MRGAFAPSKAGLTKEVVFHEGGLSKRYHCTYVQHVRTYILYVCVACTYVRTH